MNTCKHCGKEIKKTNKFCNSSCAASFNNVHRKPRTIESKQKTSSSMKMIERSPDSIERQRELASTLHIRRKSRVYTVSEETKRRISVANTGRKCSEEKRQQMSILAKERGLGGHTSKRKLNFMKNDGTVVYLQSSYEIRFASILEDLQVEWIRPQPLQWVDDQGISHRYYPDFKVGNKYFDTKNDYLAVIDARKIELVSQQNDVDLTVITNNQITKEYIASVV